MASFYCLAVSSLFIYPTEMPFRRLPLKARLVGAQKKEPVLRFMPNCFGGIIFL